MMLHGDCLELLPRVATGSVDMVFADLPYGVTANKWDSVIPFEPLWEQLLRVGKRNAAFVFTATFKFACALKDSQPDYLRYDLIWEKGRPTGMTTAKRQPLRAHESILVFYRAQPTYNPQMQPGGRKYGPQKANGGSENSGNADTHTTAYVKENKVGMNYPRSVLFFPSVNNREILHPTQKPVALLEWLIRTYTNSGEVVLDPTAGSGTTLVACANTGRHGIGIEKDAAYFATAQARLDRAQLALPGAA